MTENSEQNQALEQVKAFGVKNEYFGIPGNIFVMIIGLSIGIAVAVKSIIIGIVMILFLGFPAYYIHRNDPHAAKIWLRAYKRKHNRWSAGTVAQRDLIILDRKE